jgi:protein-disulfide isomerase
MVSSTLEELVKEYDGKVRVVYKNMVVHPNVVLKAHQAGCAAGKQGKFNEFRHSWWEIAFANRKFDDAAIEDVAKAANADPAKLKLDLDSDACKQRVGDDMNELRKFHVNSTPSFFINGQHIGGALQKDQFKQIIDQKLKDVDKSGVAAGDYYNSVVMAKGEKQFKAKGG